VRFSLVRVGGDGHVTAIGQTVPEGEEITKGTGRGAHRNCREG
jgi:hypothetical protein